MQPSDWNNQTDPSDLRNTLYQLQQRVEDLERGYLAVERLSEISDDAGVLYNGETSARMDGVIESIVFNRVMLFTGTVRDVIAIPATALVDKNVLWFSLRGTLHQQTGAAYNLTPKLYLGPLGGEELVSSNVSLSIGSSTVERTFDYLIKVTQAPSFGKNVRVSETFIVESATAGTPQVLSRTTILPITSITDSLAEVDNAILQLSTSAPATEFVIYPEIFEYGIDDGTWGDERVFWSRVGTCATIQSDAAATTSALLRIGESNAAATRTYRALIKCPDLSNIPRNWIVKEARVGIKFQTDLATNTGTIQAFRVLRNWNAPTWNQYSTGNNWFASGGVSGQDYDSVLWGSVFTGNAQALNAWTSINLDLTEMQKVIDGTYADFYGLFLRYEVELNNAYQFYECSHATPQFRPMWELVLQAPEDEG